MRLVDNTASLNDMLVAITHWMMSVSEIGALGKVQGKAKALAVRREAECLQTGAVGWWI